MDMSKLLEQMTLKEKCSIITGKDVWHTQEVKRLGIPSITLADGPSGLRKQAASGDHLGLNASTKATCIPSASTLANSWNIELAQQMGRVVGQDAREQDVQILLAPGINVKRSPLCGRSFEYYSEDPYLAGKMASRFILGVQSTGTSACVKHFAANSQELLRMHSDSIVDERTLRELYLTNFEIAIKEGKPHAVMSAYNKLNGVYCSENPFLLNDTLRKNWAFDGIVITDWGGSNDIVSGVTAGMNLEMPAAGADSQNALLSAVRSGLLSESIIDQRVKDLLHVILKQNPVSTVSDPKERASLVQYGAEQCIVLLKNDQQILPLNRQEKVAIIGDFAAHGRVQGAGSSCVNPPPIQETVTLFSDYFSNALGYAKGFDRLGQKNETLSEEAIELARNADVVLLYLGLPEGYETEGLDRSHMRLPENQVDLLLKLHAIQDRIIVVLTCGCVVEMPWIDHCQGLLYGGLGGQCSAVAMLRTIVGEVNPGGKLAETIPLIYEDTPASRYFPGKEATAEYRESLFVGYRYFTTANKPVRFPFGFGLSYTNFHYDDLNVNSNGVSFTLKNCGAIKGDEVAQLYISLPNSSVIRPVKELKGFCRVCLNAGEQRRIQIPFDEYSFRYFETLSCHFEIEPGDYQIMVGSSCEDIRLQATFSIIGSTKTNSRKTNDLFFPEHDISDAEFTKMLGHPIPQHFWQRQQPLVINDTIQQLCYAKNMIARLIARLLQKKADAAIRAGKPNLNLLFILNLPFRGIAKMTNGMINRKMAEDLLFMVNGHWHRGLMRFLIHTCKRPRRNH